MAVPNPASLITCRGFPGSLGFNANGTALPDREPIGVNSHTLCPRALGRVSVGMRAGQVRPVFGEARAQCDARWVDGLNVFPEDEEGTAVPPGQEPGERKGGIDVGPGIAHIR